jgi:DNA invertase Pin-like site-specific DNA recombinase
MLIGYARISTADQNLHLQKDALTAAGCTQICEDTISGAKTTRPGLEKALGMLREGDTLVVWKLDRLGRSLKHLIESVQALDSRGIGFKSLRDNIDTTTSGGKLLFHILGSLAEFERDLIRERTNAGLAAARARGRKGGRPPGGHAKKQEAALVLRQDPKRSVQEICEMLHISQATFYRYTSAGKEIAGKKETEENDFATRRN